MKSALKQFQKKAQGSSDDKKHELLSSAYEEAMERINGQQKGFQLLAKNVLSWITCAKRPLTTRELQHAIAVEIDEPELDEDNLPEIKDIVSVCAGLVTIDEESKIIRLVHYTTQEYFNETRGKWFPNAQTNITTICITYLLFDEFESGICQSDNKFEQRLQSNKLYDYAAHNWGHHAREASTWCQEIVMEFLQKQPQFEASSQALLAEKLYSSDTSYSQIFPKNMTGLHLAAYFGVEAVVPLLLATDTVDVDAKDNNGRTPLWWAAWNGHEGTVALLLEKGAELETKDNDGWTPLSCAAWNGHKGTVALLLEEGAELETKDNDGRTPLSCAAWNGHKGTVALLLEKGAELETKDNNGRTPLWWAAVNGHEGTVALLLEKGVELETKDNNGRTSLLWAARKGHEGIVTLLLEKGAELETKDTDGQTPLSWAAANGHEGIVALLLEKGAELETKNIRGNKG